MDKDLLAADLSSLTESDQARISSVVDQMQTRDSCKKIFGVPFPSKPVQIPMLHLDREEQYERVPCKTDAVLCSAYNMQGTTLGLIAPAKILRLYSYLSQRCFSDCVTTFYRKALGKQEEICVRRCTEKFLRLSASVATRFAELNQDGSRQ